MAKRLQLRRGTTTEHSTFTGAVGEVTVDATNKTLRVHDGAIVGGTALAKVSQLPTPASETTQGLIEIATQTEVNAGTDSTRAIVPNTLLGGMRTHLNASGTAPIYACRAWVNFNGTGTVAIISSRNVSSVTDNGVGDYTINFTTAMPDANYAIAFGGVEASDGTPIVTLLRMTGATPILKTTSAFRVSTRSSYNAGLLDMTSVSAQVFG